MVNHVRKPLRFSLESQDFLDSLNKRKNVSFLLKVLRLQTLYTYRTQF